MIENKVAYANEALNRSTLSSINPRTISMMILTSKDRVSFFLLFDMLSIMQQAYFLIQTARFRPCTENSPLPSSSSVTSSGMLPVISCHTSP